jgi:hypothetical protein
VPLDRWLVASDVGDPNLGWGALREHGEATRRLDRRDHVSRWSELLTSPRHRRGSALRRGLSTPHCDSR